jgi:hypothetical protein
MESFVKKHFLQRFLQQCYGFFIVLTLVAERFKKTDAIVYFEIIR